MKGILSAGVKMCWGFTVADVHLSHTGFLNSLELKRTIGNIVLFILYTTVTVCYKHHHSLSPSSSEIPEPVPAPVGRNQPPVEINPEPVMLACMALFLCTNSVCDRDMFSAVVDSGLVFDGGLVVDTVS